MAGPLCRTALSGYVDAPRVGGRCSHLACKSSTTCAPGRRRSRWATAFVSSSRTCLRRSPARRRGRSLPPVIATNRTAKVNKDIIAQAEMHVFMKAMLDIDLDRYYDYFNKSLVSREQLRGFQAGEAVVCLPDGSQTITRLLQRESRHLSHTPHVTAALTTVAGTALRGPVEVDGALGAAPTSLAAAGVPSADQATRRVTAPPPEQPALPEQTAHLWQPAKPGPPLPSPNRLGQPIAAVQQPRPVKAPLTPELKRALQAWRTGATAARGLAVVLHQ